MFSRQFSCFRLALALAATAARADETAAAQPDNGTDPTKVTSSAGTSWEHLDLRGGFSQDTVKFNYTAPVPLGERTSLRLQVPVTRNDVLGNDSFGLGDLSLKLTDVFKVTKSYGLVLAGELTFDTAARPELGASQTVLKPSFIYAKFLPGGHIFAPAIVQSIGVAGISSDARVNGTVLDFYYVPKLGTKKVFLTFDPALSHDWKNDRTFASLAVTAGFPTGPALGGSSQLFVKSTVFAGHDRRADWGVEIGCKIIGL